MKLQTSFRSKLLLLTIVPLVLAQAVTLFAVMRTAEHDIDRRATESLVIGGSVVAEFLRSRGEQLRTSVEVLAADFGLKQAAATGDAGTIRSVLENHSQRVGADIGMLLDVEGALVSSSVGTTIPGRTGIRNLIPVREDATSKQSTAVIDGHTYHVFAVRLRAPLTIGWVVLGFRLDAELADKIADLTGMDVSILSISGDERQIVATTLPDSLAQSLPGGVFPDGSPLHDTYTLGPPSDAWFALGRPFIEDLADVIVVLQRSRVAAMAPYTDARVALLAFAAFLVLLTAACAGWFSLSVAKPLRTLTDAARRMISGNYDSQVRVTSGDEFGALASSFNAMRQAIAEREQRISHQALHDPLTGLPNRAKLIQSLTRSIEAAQHSGAKIAVMAIRLKRIESISSTLGHSASDQVIALAAKHLCVNLNEGEILGHIKSDEFVLILPGISIDESLTYADRVENILGAGVTLGRINIALQTEIGVCEYPQHGVIAADLLRHASIARTEAEKRQDRIACYESGREDYYLRQLRIVNDLRGALQRDEVHIHYQPKICLRDGKACGAEALVRWQHPEFGWLSPDDFIPAAEQAGTIVHLTRHVLKGALRDCREWKRAGFNLRVCVNISARDLQDEYLPHYILQLLGEQQLQPNNLTLEVTESGVMSEPHLAKTVLHCLRDIGVRISMDDFGTGHSSLGQLRNIPLHELKIDKSFVMTMVGDKLNEALVKTTIELAHNMELEVVAEGVEDEATLRHLSSEGCEQAQGYFFSRPLPSRDLQNWLRNHEPQIWSERRSQKRAFINRA
ncbi:MAG: EAL domain-containing protein [Gammaproteobacteria bacterium]|nr:EAL domain-containing protein [Gammaproteobacteria bacterium]